MLVTQFFSGWLIVCRSACWLWLRLWVLTSLLVGLNLVALRLSCDLPLQGCFNCLFVSLLTKAFRSYVLKIQIQHYTVDYLAQGSMKNGANSEMPCELQDTWTSTLWTHIAEISSSCFHTWLRVGLTSIKQLAVLHWAVTLSHPSGVSVCGSKICWLSLQSLNSWDFQSWVVRCLLQLCKLNLPSCIRIRHPTYHLRPEFR